MNISDNEFKRIVEFVRYNYGINLSTKKILVTGRLENYLIKNGYDSYDEFIKKAEMCPSGNEARDLVNYLTTNHTYFLREPIHFNFMKDEVLPQLIKKEQAAKDIRIWSGASSTGEEPYTIAMVLRDFFSLVPGVWDTRLLATDISTRALEKAIAGVYLSEQLNPLPTHWKTGCFDKINNEQFVVKKEIKEQVIFRSFNLMNPFPFKRKFHIIFLRNVMIYFEEDTKRRIIDKISSSLEPGGYLFIGTTENIDRESTDLEYIRPSIYRKPLK